MSQFEVFDNPIPRARRDFPFVAVLQAEIADTGGERIVAPLVPRKRIPRAVGRLTPLIKVAEIEHVLLVPRMTSVAAADLKTRRGQLDEYRESIVAAIDFLFLGV